MDDAADKLSETIDCSRISSGVPSASTNGDANQLERYYVQDKTLLSNRSSIESNLSFPSREPSLIEELRIRLENEHLKKRRPRKNASFPLSSSSRSQNSSFNTNEARVAVPKGRKLNLHSQPKEGSTTNFTVENESLSSIENEQPSDTSLNLSRNVTSKSSFKRPASKRVSVNFNIDSSISDDSATSLDHNSLLEDSKRKTREVATLRSTRSRGLRKIDEKIEVDFTLNDTLASEVLNDSCNATSSMPEESKGSKANLRSRFKKKLDTNFTLGNESSSIENEQPSDTSLNLSRIVTSKPSFKRTAPKKVSVNFDIDSSITDDSTTSLDHASVLEGSKHKTCKVATLRSTHSHNLRKIDKNIDVDFTLNDTQASEILTNDSCNATLSVAEKSKFPNAMASSKLIEEDLSTEASEITVAKTELRLPLNELVSECNAVVEQKFVSSISEDNTKMPLENYKQLSQNKSSLKLANTEKTYMNVDNDSMNVSMLTVAKTCLSSDETGTENKIELSNNATFTDDPNTKVSCSRRSKASNENVSVNLTLMSLGQTVEPVETAPSDHGITEPDLSTHDMSCSNTGLPTNKGSPKYIGCESDNGDIPRQTVALSDQSRMLDHVAEKASLEFVKEKETDHSSFLLVEGLTELNCQGNITKDNGERIETLPLNAVTESQLSEHEMNYSMTTNRPTLENVDCKADGVNSPKQCLALSETPCLNFTNEEQSCMPVDNNSSMDVSKITVAKTAFKCLRSHRLSVKFDCNDLSSDDSQFQERTEHKNDSTLTGGLCTRASALRQSKSTNKNVTINLSLGSLDRSDEQSETSPSNHGTCEPNELSTHVMECSNMATNRRTFNDVDCKADGGNLPEQHLELCATSCMNFSNREESCMSVDNNSIMDVSKITVAKTEFKRLRSQRLSVKFDCNNLSSDDTQLEEAIEHRNDTTYADGLSKKVSGLLQSKFTNKNVTVDLSLASLDRTGEPSNHGTSEPKLSAHKMECFNSVLPPDKGTPKEDSKSSKVNFPNQTLTSSEKLRKLDHIAKKASSTFSQEKQTVESSMLPVEESFVSCQENIIKGNVEPVGTSPSNDGSSKTELPAHVMNCSHAILPTNICALDDQGREVDDENSPEPCLALSETSKISNRRSTRAASLQRSRASSKNVTINMPSDQTGKFVKSAPLSFSTSEPELSPPKMDCSNIVDCKSPERDLSKQTLDQLNQEEEEACLEQYPCKKSKLNLTNAVMSCSSGGNNSSMDVSKITVANTKLKRLRSQQVSVNFDCNDLSIDEVETRDETGTISVINQQSTRASGLRGSKAHKKNVTVNFSLGSLNLTGALVETSNHDTSKPDLSPPDINCSNIVLPMSKDTDSKRDEGSRQSLVLCETSTSRKLDGTVGKANLKQLSCKQTGLNSAKTEDSLTSSDKSSNMDFSQLTVEKTEFRRLRSQKVSIKFDCNDLSSNDISTEGNSEPINDTKFTDVISSQTSGLRRNKSPNKNVTINFTLGSLDQTGKPIETEQSNHSSSKPDLSTHQMDSSSSMLPMNMSTRKEGDSPKQSPTWSEKSSVLDHVADGKKTVSTSLSSLEEPANCESLNYSASDLSKTSNKSSETNFSDDLSLAISLEGSNNPTKSSVNNSGESSSSIENEQRSDSSMNMSTNVASNHDFESPISKTPSTRLHFTDSSVNDDYIVSLDRISFLDNSKSKSFKDDTSLSTPSESLRQFNEQVNGNFALDGTQISEVLTNNLSHKGLSVPSMSPLVLEPSVQNYFCEEKQLVTNAYNKHADVSLVNELQISQLDESIVLNCRENITEDVYEESELIRNSHPTNKLPTDSLSEFHSQRDLTESSFQPLKNTTKEITDPSTDSKGTRDMPQERNENDADDEHTSSCRENVNIVSHANVLNITYTMENVGQIPTDSVNAKEKIQVSTVGIDNLNQRGQVESSIQSQKHTTDNLLSNGDSLLDTKGPKKNPRKKYEHPKEINFDSTLSDTHTSESVHTEKRVKSLTGIGSKKNEVNVTFSTHACTVGDMSNRKEEVEHSFNGDTLTSPPLARDKPDEIQKSTATQNVLMLKDNEIPHFVAVNEASNVVTNASTSGHSIEQKREVAISIKETNDMYQKAALLDVQEIKMILPKKGLKQKEVNVDFTLSDTPISESIVSKDTTIKPEKYVDPVVRKGSTNRSVNVAFSSQSRMSTNEKSTFTLQVGDSCIANNLEHTPSNPIVTENEVDESVTVTREVHHSHSGDLNSTYPIQLPKNNSLDTIAKEPEFADISACLTSSDISIQNVSKIVCPDEQGLEKSIAKSSAIFVGDQNMKNDRLGSTLSGKTMHMASHHAPEIPHTGNVTDNAPVIPIVDALAQDNIDASLDVENEHESLAGHSSNAKQAPSIEVKGSDRTNINDEQLECFLANRDLIDRPQSSKSVDNAEILQSSKKRDCLSQNQSFIPSSPATEKCIENPPLPTTSQIHPSPNKYINGSAHNEDPLNNYCSPSVKSVRVEITRNPRNPKSILVDTVNRQTPIVKHPKSKRKSISFKPTNENVYHSPPDYLYHEGNQNHSASTSKQKGEEYEEFSQIQMTSEISDIQGSVRVTRSKRHYCSTPLPKSKKQCVSSKGTDLTSKDDEIFAKPLPVPSDDHANGFVIPHPPLNPVVPADPSPKEESGNQAGVGASSSSEKTSVDLSYENSLNISAIPKDKTAPIWGNVFHSTPLHRRKTSKVKNKKKHTSSSPLSSSNSRKNTPHPHLVGREVVDNHVKVKDRSVNTSRTLRSRSRLESIISQSEGSSQSSYRGHSETKSRNRSRQSQSDLQSESHQGSSEVSAQPTAKESSEDLSSPSRISMKDDTVLSSQATSRFSARGFASSKSGRSSHMTRESAFSSFDSHRKLPSRRLFTNETGDEDNRGDSSNQKASSSQEAESSSGTTVSKTPDSLAVEGPSTKYNNLLDYNDDYDVRSISSPRPPGTSRDDCEMSSGAESISAYTIPPQPFRSQIDSLRRSSRASSVSSDESEVSFQSENRHLRPRNGQSTQGFDEFKKPKSKFSSSRKTSNSKNNDIFPKVKSNKRQRAIMSSGSDENQLEWSQKPRKLFKPGKWASKKLYSWLEQKLKAEHGLSSTMMAEKMVICLQHAYMLVVNGHSDNALETVRGLAVELNLCSTELEFWSFIHKFMPFDFRIKVIPMGGAFGSAIRLKTLPREAL